MLDQSEWKGWPSGKCEQTLAVTISQEEFERLYGLKFIRDHEPGLGGFNAAHFIDDQIGPVVIFKFDHLEHPLIEIDANVDPSVGIARLISVLGLKPGQYANLNVPWSGAAV
jgi:hypothetical protein